MRNILDYLDLPYHITLIQDAWDDGTPGWFVRVEELPGCMSQGRTPDEALEQIRDAMLGWKSVMQEEGDVIPEPWPADMEMEVVYFPVPTTVARRLRRLARERGVRPEALA